MSDEDRRRPGERTTHEGGGGFGALVEQASDGIFIGDAHGRYQDVNAAGCEMLGHSRDEIVGATIADFVAPEEEPRIAPELARLAGGRAVKSEWRFRRKDGSFFDGEISVRQLPDSRVLSSLRDVSQRKQVERSLEHSQALLQSFVEHTPAAVAMLDKDLRYLFVSRRWLQDYQLGERDLRGLHHYDVFPEIRSLDHWQQIHRRGLAGEILRCEEDPFVRADGHTDWLRWEVRPWLDEKGEIGGIIMYTEVITERKRAEEKLRESRLHLLASQRIARVGSWELALTRSGEPDPDSLRWSTECHRVFGYESGDGESVGDKFWSRVHPEDRQKIRAAIRRAVDTRSVYTMEYRIVLDDGAVRVIQERAELVMDARSGRPEKFIGTSQDVTQRLELEAQLRQSQKMQAIGQLAGGVAHDFNNLLTVIHGECELLVSSLSAPSDPIHESVDAIRAAVERATLLTRQLLLFSRKAVLESKLLDLNEAIQGTCKMLQRLIGEHLTFTTVLASSLQRVRIDPGQIEQVIINLALNARDAMPHGGRLSIETRNASFTESDSQLHPGCRPGDFVELAVSDTGCGMTAEVQTRLFEPFFTTKGPGKGTGLGLATVYGIVVQSGGFIGVSSEPDRGTTFRVFLPAVEDEASASPAEGTDPGLHGSETVLLVEDEPGVRRVARIALEMRGYRVLEARDGPEAIRVLEEHAGTVDLLLTDVVMPEMSGRELARQLRARRPDLRVLFMSGYSADAMIVQGMDEKTNGFQHKPFTPLGLARKVRDVLDGRS